MHAMNVALREPWMIEEFLGWEERQELRYEFDGADVHAMTGGTESHAMIQSNLLRAVGNRLNRPPCRIVGSELKLVMAGSVRYPDAMILWSPPRPRRTSVANPVIVFEILGDSTARIDLIRKNGEYRGTPSIQRYVILEQASATAIVFSRKAEDWVTEIISGDEASLHLPEVGIEFPLSELYRDIELVPESEPAAEP
jgi:Uma2 family endonuclease